MPTVVLQVGQCGNQLGHALWQSLSAQRRNASSSSVGDDLEFFCPQLSGRKVARCLLVDTEPKVVSVDARWHALHAPMCCGMHVAEGPMQPMVCLHPVLTLSRQLV